MKAAPLPPPERMIVKKLKDKEKAKCKDAARMRREKERTEFVELSKLLPLPGSITSQLDKASIIRLTSSYLRMRAAFPQGLGENWGRNKSNNNDGDQQQQQPEKVGGGQHQQQQAAIRELGSHILQTLDGFVFALHRDGKIMYISETASVHLGLPQIDLTGSSIFDFIHAADHADLREILGLSERDRTELRARQLERRQQENQSAELSRSFCLRMKCVLPKRNAGLVTNGYKAIHCTGYLKARRPPTDLGPNSDDWSAYALVAVGHSLLPTASTELKLSASSFMFRANLDLRLQYIEQSAVRLLGYDQFDMIGQSLYQFVHAADIANLDEAHRTLLSKGQVVTKYYRLVRQGGGTIWVQMYSTLIHSQRNSAKSQHIVSVCFVLSDEQPRHQRSSDNSSCILLQPDQAAAQGQTNQPNGPTGRAARKRNSSEAELKSRVRTRESKPPSGRKIAHDNNAVPTPWNHMANADGTQMEQNDFSGSQNPSIWHLSCCDAQPNSADNLDATPRGSSFVDQRSSRTNCIYQTIGSIRRPSEDSCSVASTSVSSTTSLNFNSHEHNLNLHQHSDKLTQIHQPISSESVFMEHASATVDSEHKNQLTNQTLAAGLSVHNVIGNTENINDLEPLNSASSDWISDPKVASIDFGQHQPFESSRREMQETHQSHSHQWLLTKQSDEMHQNFYDHHTETARSYQNDEPYHYTNADSNNNDVNVALDSHYHNPTTYPQDWLVANDTFGGMQFNSSAHSHVFLRDISPSSIASHHSYNYGQHQRACTSHGYSI